jgi:glycosyltransferase involved in cell wall biosynthesis
MKLLIFTHSLASGGAERVTSSLANNLSQHGWQVTIVTVASKKLDFYKTHRAVRRVEFDLAREAPNPAAAISDNIKRVVKLRNVLREVKPEFALGMMSTANIILLLASAGLSGVRAIVSERVYPPAVPLGRVWEGLRRLMYPSAQCVVMQTGEGLEWLKAEIPKACGAIIPNPIPYPLPATDPYLSPADWVSPDRKLLLAVGRLTEQKGFDCLLDAFATLALQNREWDLVILGEGDQRAELEGRVQALDLTTRVRLPGRAGNVGDWYARADLYVMSSRFEGFPNTLGEAMAHGCAAVSFDCDTGPRDIIRHGEDGLLVSPAGNVQALTAALSELMQNDALRTEMASKATDVRQRYSTTHILTIWNNLLGYDPV